MCGLSVRLLAWADGAVPLSGPDLLREAAADIERMRAVLHAHGLDPDVCGFPVPAAGPCRLPAGHPGRHHWAG